MMVSKKGRLTMQFLYLTGAITYCLLKGGGFNVVFASYRDHDLVSAK